MDRVALALALVALIGVALLLFGYAALLRIVRSLQLALVERQPSGARERASGTTPIRLEALARGAGDTAVLVADEHCPSCADRIADLEGMVADGLAPAEAIVVLKPAGAPSPATRIRQLVDPELVGRLDTDTTPLLVILDSDGVEKARRVVGDARVLKRLLSEAFAPADRQPPAEVR